MWRLLWVGLFVGLVACDGEVTIGLGTSFGTTEPTGTYTLQSVGRRAVPATFVTVGNTRTFAAGSLSLRRDRTFSMALTTITPDRSGTVVTTDQFTGTYVQSAHTLTFFFTDGAVTDGSWSGNTVTLFDFGTTLVFRRL